MIVLNLLVKPVWIFFIDRQVQIVAGNEAYGKYFAVLNLSYMLLFLADAGLSVMVNQRLASRSGVNARQLLRIKLFMVAVYIAACCCIAWISHISQWQLLFYIIISQSLTSIFAFLRSIVTAGQYFTVDAWFSVLDKSLMVISCGSILYTSLFGKMSLLLFLQIQVACTCLAISVLATFIARKKLMAGGKNEKIIGIARWVLPFALVILLMAIHYRLDGFLLERLHHQGAEQAGIYASAYRLLDAGNIAGYMAASFLVPFIARHQRDKTVMEETVIHTRHALLFLSIGIACFSFIFSEWIQQLLYHAGDAYHAKVMRYCLAALPAYFLVHIYGSVLTATSRLSSFIVLLLSSVLINLTLNLLLIPSQGALGCCLAALASQYFCGFATMFLASRKAEISVRPLSLLLYCLTAVLLLLFFYFGKMAVSNVWIILATAALITIVLLATQSGYIKKYFFSLR